jgi:putative restriction endonuclease
VPDDFVPHVGQGKRYSLDKGEGRRLVKECLTRARRMAASDRIADGPVDYGTALAPRPRLGPLSSAAAVFDAYDRRCAVTGEASVPALTAVRIRELPGAAGFPVSNAILLRADIARLFEAGYLTITPESFLRVSATLRKASDDYAALDGRPVRIPRDASLRPMVESLWWHNETKFLGKS